MSYLTFHLLFLLPPIALLLVFTKQPQSSASNFQVIAGIPVICTLAFIYTTPWDNYLVARNVWWYGPERVSAIIGYVPIEEYLFFILQPLLTGLFLYQYLARRNPESHSPSSYAPWTGFAVFTALSGIGTIFLTDGRPQTLYIALILVWASPLLAAMWLYDGETLWANRFSLLVGTGVPTLYLWGADAIAIHENIWMISATYTLDFSGFGLPVEEATFFLFTNLLVTQGLILFLFGSHTLPGLVPTTRWNSTVGEGSAETFSNPC